MEGGPDSLTVMSEVADMERLGSVWLMMMKAQYIFSRVIQRAEWSDLALRRSKCSNSLSVADSLSFGSLTDASQLTTTTLTRRY